MLLGYVRVSTIEQAADGTTSLQEQRRVIQGYAMAKGYTQYDLQIFEDKGISGSLHLNYRPAGHDLLELAKPGDTVVAAKLDRMFRNSLDALKVFTDFRERGINLVLFDLGIEPITGDTGIGKLIFQVMAAFADLERERIRDRVLSGKQAKLANGGHIGGEAPYGYRIIGSGRTSKLEMCEAEQEVIKKVVAMKERYQPPFIARMLADQGVFSRSGKPFQKIQIQRIIKNNAHVSH